MMRTLVLSLLVVALAGCASVPKPLQGTVNPITPREATQTDAAGATVRWGGRIVSTEPGASQTCFEMIGSTLQSSGRPADMSDDGSGRFIACKSGFYDPAIFLKDRELTVLGRIDGYESRKIGDYDYRQPRVAADVIYLWPKARPVDARYPAPRPWPWYGWDWGPGWWGW
jgi:outer membrane lipoprotein